MRASRREIDGDLLAMAEVHFIRRLASEGGMWNDGIVLLDIERDQLLERRECVQLVQKQPAMLHGPPQGLDHGIGISDLDLGEDAVQLPESQKAVDLAIDVLDARVGNYGGAIAILGEILRCLDEKAFVIAGDEQCLWSGCDEESLLEGAGRQALRGWTTTNGQMVGTVPGRPTQATHPGALETVSAKSNYKGSKKRRGLLNGKREIALCSTSSNSSAPKRHSGTVPTPSANS